MKAKIYSKIHSDIKAANDHEDKIKSLGGTIVKRIDRIDRDPKQILIQYTFKIKKHESKFNARA
jgi:hypothetical protein